MKSKIKQGDVWLANVYFMDKNRLKQCPVITVGNELALDVDVIIAPIITKTQRNHFAESYFSNYNYLLPVSHNKFIFLLPILLIQVVLWCQNSPLLSSRFRIKPRNL
ncbi:hypothetical protein [Virgibacillus doumboii]|uniref:hypothetical protein n=1 Tax=Virgibacillus doumboii TaxID=2697503 RepID=UPI0013DFF919|nr:hypothetical protein [Virgibacillus doumboii]